MLFLSFTLFGWEKYFINNRLESTNQQNSVFGSSLTLPVTYKRDSKICHGRYGLIEQQL